MFPTRLEENFRKFRADVLEWLDYYFKLPKTIVCIYGLIVVHAWIENALVAILITHLTEDNWFHLPKAASIVNVQDGMTAVFVLLVAYASDAHLGPFKSVVSTTIGYVFGLLLLFFGAWRLQSIEVHLIYVAVMLIALGRAGRDISLREFLTDQFRVEGSSEDEVEDEKRAESRRKVWWRSAYFLGIGASPYLLTNSPWVKLCKISAIAMAAAFALFIGGSAFYKRKKPTKSISARTVLRLIYAAIRNRHLSHTFDKDHILDVRGLRWLDKAAIEESRPVAEQTRQGRFFSVNEVREVKTLLTMVPLWTTFLVYGLLQATGNTFFYEQAGYTDNHLGKIKNVPVVIFLIIRTSTSFIVSRLCDLLFTTYWRDRNLRLANLARIAGGMAISPLCCIVAWRVENYRRHKHVNLDIYISFLWIVPQFVLLGVVDGLVYDGMEEIFYTVVPKSLSKYGPSCTQFALEIGNFISLVSVLFFHGLFNDDLNTSRLDVYYASLGLICFVNFVFYCYVATHYVNEKSSDDQGIEQGEQQLQILEDNRPEENQPHVG